MKPERVVLIAILGLLVLVVIKLPVIGIITLERAFDSYPIVSRETIAVIDEMGVALGDFDTACDEHQAAQRDLYLLQNCFSLEMDVEACDRHLADVQASIESATAAMYAAVARRKTIAARTGWGLLRTMALGTQTYTHSTWLCAPAYAAFSTQIDVGFTPTYHSS